MVGEAWERYWRSWKPLLAANLASMLLTWAATVGMLLWLFGPVFARMLTRLDFMVTESLSPEAAGRIGAGMLLFMIVILFVSFFVQGGVYGTVAAVWRNPDAPAFTFWAEGFRNWWRMLKIFLVLLLCFFLPAALLFGLVAVIVAMLPLPVWLTSLLYLLVAVVGGLPLLSAGGYYAPYAAVADGAGGMYALQAAWRALTRGYADCLSASLMILLLSLLIGLVFAVVMALVALIGRYLFGADSVLLNLLAVLLESLLLPSFLIIYGAVRYETNQRMHA
jgi:hypothetical protein